MPNPFASGRKAIAECDRCGFRYKLSQLKELTIKFTKVNILVCKDCWEPSHPQLMLGTFPVEDPQAVRNPRPDRSYLTSGLDANGDISMGSRDIQWGWAPVGGGLYSGLTPDNLVTIPAVGTVTVNLA